MRRFFTFFTILTCLPNITLQASPNCLVAGEVAVSNLNESEALAFAANLQGTFSALQVANKPGKRILVYEAANSAEFENVNRLIVSADWSIAETRVKGKFKFSEEAGAFFGSCTIQVCEIGAWGWTIAGLVGVVPRDVVLLATGAVTSVGIVVRGLLKAFTTFVGIRDAPIFYVQIPRTLTERQTNIDDPSNRAKAKTEIKRRLQRRKRAEENFSFIITNGKLPNEDWRQISQELELEQIPARSFVDFMPKNLVEHLKPDASLIRLSLTNFRSPTLRDHDSRIILQSAEDLGMTAENILERLIMAENIMPNTLDVRALVKSRNVHIVYAEDVLVFGEKSLGPDTANYPVGFIYESKGAVEVVLWKRYDKRIFPELVSRIRTTIERNLGQPPSNPVKPTEDTDIVIYNTWPSIVRNK